jgi:hypothetical protein
MYVLVVPFIWLMAMTPAAAIAMSVVGDVARPIVGVIATSMLAWRDYEVARERLIGGALVALAIVFVGHIELLMGLGGAFLLVAFAGWVLQRAGGPLAPGPLHLSGHGQPNR